MNEDLLPTVIEVECRCHAVFNIRTNRPSFQRQCRKCGHQIRVHLRPGKGNLTVMFVEDGGAETDLPTYEVIAQGWN